MDNKVHYDLMDVYIAPLTGSPASPAYGEPKALEGAISMDLAAQGDQVKLRADGMDYYVNYSNNGYNGNLNLAQVPDWFREEILGETLTEKDKVLVEDANAEPKPFAMTFTFKGDKSKRRHVLYNCVSGRPNLAGNNKENSKEPDTESLNLTASPLANGKTKASTTANTPTSVVDNWNKAIWLSGTDAAQT